MKRSPLWLGWLLLGCAGGGEPATTSAGQATGPTVLLVALDGFHPSYLDRPPSRHLRRLAEGGVRARWMVPVFPTLTFPNFYSIATGLYPEHHGIVSNTMRDPALGRFSLGNTSAVRDPRWWGGEPIWVTVVRQGKRAATFFWPGSDVAIGGVRPTYYKLYDPNVPNAERVRQVLEWLSLPADRAPILVTLYLADVDQAGHEFGPMAPETDSAIARVDSAVGAVMAGIEERGLKQVNMIVVSDHGMAELDSSRVIYLDDYIDLASVEIVDRGPFLSLIPRTGVQQVVYQRLRGAHPHLQIYRKSEVPAAYHYREHPRIPPVVGVADEGWIVATRNSIASRGGQRLARGGHGYPPDAETMRAIFLARGPAFGSGLVVEPFSSIHVYPLVTHVLGLEPVGNDGVLDSIYPVLAEPLQKRP